MSDKTHSAVLKHKLFKGLDRDKVEEFLSYASAREKTFDREEVVVHMGDRLKSVILVISGRVNVVQQTRDGTELIDITVEDGGVIGSSFALAKGTQYPRMIQSAARSELVILDVAKVRELLKKEEFRPVFENFYQFLVNALMHCMFKFSVVGCWEISEKVLTYLERFSEETGSREVQIPFRTCAEFAQYLGVNRCALSRSLTQLESKGELTHRHGHFILSHGKK